MTPAEIDFQTAEGRIAREALARTGALDLSDLHDLERVPDGLYSLIHLHSLIVHKALTYRGSSILVDFALLSGLVDLISLSVARTVCEDLAFVLRMQILRNIDFSSTQVADLEPLASLTSLQSLDCGSTQVADLAPLAKLQSLQALDCSDTQVADLGPLAKLQSLRSLDCSASQVADLGPLAELQSLQSLTCWDTQVADLGPLAKLQSLQSFNCQKTQVANLAPFTKLQSLQSLDCSYSKVADLGPLANLQSLQWLDCGDTQVADLAPLAKLLSLRSLVCSNTQVADLAPLAKLLSLQFLVCSTTQVANLAPLANLQSLQSLDCQYTRVTDLTPLAKLQSLQSLNCGGCTFGPFPEALLELPLETIQAWEASFAGLPPGLIGDNNCLPALRAHFAELAQEAASLTDIRVLLLGNGRVGKTQIANWLHRLPFDPKSKSTHGIRTSFVPAVSEGGPTLRLWDFGGQDIYHGAHALFLRRPALVVLAWTPEQESRENHTHAGDSFRNYQLDYWLLTIRAHLGADTPVIIVQTHWDHAGQPRLDPPVAADIRKSLNYLDLQAFGAETRRGAAALREAIDNAVGWLRDPDRLGLPRIGARRLAVQRHLEALIAADQAHPPTEREHRWLERAHFADLCADHGLDTDPALLLHYFDAIGLLVHRAGLFGDRVILDQQWALDAIYTIFKRDEANRELRQRRGEFTRRTLSLLVWHAFDVKEQRVLLDMMRACGMCFCHSRPYGGEDEAVYIAPDLLPERAEVVEQLADRWKETTSCETATYHFSVLHAGLIRALMSDIGELAGPAGVYWRGGLSGYDADTRSRFIIDEDHTEGWRGVIRLRAQAVFDDPNARPAELLSFLTERMDRAQNQFGQSAEKVERSSPPDPTTSMKTPAFAQEKPKPEWAVSYAWGDDRTAEGRERERHVDEACDAAKARGTYILRDKDVMKVGDSIAAFEGRIGKADRIFVFLSQKYLRSPHCMYELSEIWRNARHEGPAFLDRVRVYTHDDAEIWTLKARLTHSLFWQGRHREIEDLVRQHGTGILGEDGSRELRRMQKFYTEVVDILATIADRVKPRDFTAFLADGLKD